MMNKKTLTFSLFLFFSFAVWVGGKLSDTYQDTARLSLTFDNLPPATRLPDGFEQELTVKLLTKGYVFLLNSLFGSTLNVDSSKTLTEDDGKYFLRPKDLRLQIESKFPSGTKVLEINESKIELVLEKIKFKTVPITLNPESRLPNGYFFVRPPKINPSEIVVTGPDDELAKLHLITTNKIDFTIRPNDSIYESNLILPKNSKLVFSEKKAQITYEIDQYIDLSKTVRLQIRNLPEETSALLIPEKVSIIYKVGLKSAKKLKLLESVVFVDFNNSNGLQNELDVRTDELPEWIINAKTNPEKVSWYLQPKSN